jgi:hypothetical protein
MNGYIVFWLHKKYERKDGLHAKTMDVAARGQVRQARLAADLAKKAASATVDARALRQRRRHSL